ncbi:DUF2285 domain-containing protein [Chelativorans sp. EGI FJ00035]|uniref:DUF2285 domain-containing protein n=1 Tax=Chelativorans salis TaxID=2978478 RepID=A0ABT2LUN6_9HYPH|nr:DUF2285 domain-containing protein [Chelativorans sp. EGI FJ00035]
MTAFSSSATDAIDLGRLPCDAAVVLEPEGRQHVLLHEDERHLQLSLTQGNLLRPARLLTDAVAPPDRARHHLKALGCLNDLHTRGRLSARYFPVEPRHARLRFVLRALDGALAGASHRDIAVALFGHARVRADWSDPGDHLRDRVRRAIKRGYALMNGGYRRFLL